MHAAAKWLLVLVVATIPVMLMLVLPDSGGKLPMDTTASKEEVIRNAKRLVLQKTRSPETATFPEESEFMFEQLAPNEWRVGAYVESETAVGGRNRIPWIIHVRQQGNRWVETEREHVKSQLTEDATKGSWTSRLKKQKGN